MSKTAQTKKLLKVLNSNNCCLNENCGCNGFTEGSVLFANNNGTITEDNTSFFWNRVNKQLLLRQMNGLIMSRDGEQPFALSARKIGLPFPVPTLLPNSSVSNMAFDLMPSGSPGDFSDNGICWLDVCDTECLSTNPPLAAARVGITSSSVQFGSRAFNGASNKKVEFIVGTDKRITLNTNNTSDFNIGKIIQSQSLSGDYVGYALFNTNNTVLESNSILFIGNDFGSLRFGYLRWNNAVSGINGRIGNSLEIVSNTGATGGLQIGTAGSTAPIRFTQTNGTITAVERMRIDSVGSLGIGASTIDASAKLQIDSTTKGFLPPRMTTSQRTSIVTPAEGLIVYDTDTKKSYTYDGTTWQAHF